jgi:hypothetical protein
MILCKGGAEALYRAVERVLVMSGIHEMLVSRLVVRSEELCRVEEKRGAAASPP